MYFTSYKFLSLIYLMILYHPCSLFIVIFTVVQSLDPVQLFKTPWTAASQASLSFTISQRLLKLVSIELVMTCKHLALCHSLLLLPSILPSIKWISSSHQVAKGLELQLQHQSFQWVFRIYLNLNWLVGSPYCPRDSQESSPAPQFESTNSSVLSLLYGPTIYKRC